MEPAVVGYGLASVKNQKLSSIPGAIILSRWLSRKQGLDGDMCGNGGDGVKSVTLRCNEVELCVCGNTQVHVAARWRMVLQCMVDLSKLHLDAHARQMATLVVENGCSGEVASSVEAFVF